MLTSAVSPPLVPRLRGEDGGVVHYARSSRVDGSPPPRSLDSRVKHGNDGGAMAKGRVGCGQAALDSSLRSE